MMLRTFLATLAALLLGFPASVALMVGMARLVGMAQEAALFMAVIGSGIIWTLLLFLVFWFALAERAR